ncbi:MAG: hypothetical protein ACI8QC_004558 [Planctomycetota bacterium]|jgi:hypothetical protein
MPLLALVTFLAAALAFWVELLLARYLLPWFGGGPWVWTAVTLFFQLALLLAYGYAHLLGRLSQRVQALVHMALVGAAALALDLVPVAADAPVLGDGAVPMWPLLSLMTRRCGLAFVALTASAPLFTRWASAGRESPPWMLFALSNLGAVLALALQPFVFEPLWSRATQAEYWSLGFWLWAALVCVAAVLVARRAPSLEAAGAGAKGPAPSATDRALWVLLSALSVACMLAVTRDLSQRVTPMPLLWAAPLAIYLATFAAAFAAERMSPRAVLVPLLLLAGLGLGFTLLDPDSFDFKVLLWPRLGILAVVTWALHGELYKRRPRNGEVTRYSLAMAFGGVLGGAALSLAAPLWLPIDVDLGLCLTAAGFLLAAAYGAGPWRKLLMVGTLALASVFVRVEWRLSEGRIRTLRSAYGTLSVHERNRDIPNWHWREVLNGAICHGMQYLHADNLKQPTAYYTVNSGIGIAAVLLGAEPKRVGVVGLGVGVMLAYAGPQDYWRMYELDPNMERVAREDFSYIDQAPCPVDVVLGDARLAMGGEQPNDFDLLVLDAFQGDAVPTHLLTTEAFALYKQQMSSGGLLVVHATSAHLDLRGVIAEQARAAGMLGVWIEQPADVGKRVLGSRWAILTENAAVVNRLMRVEGAQLLAPLGAPLWTDEYTPLWPLLH